METAFLNYTFYLLLVFPILLFAKKKSANFWQYLLVFIFFFILNQAMLDLPRYYKGLQFIHGNWNWSGKIFTIAASVLFLVLYRGLTAKDVGLTLRQKGSLKLPLILVFIFILVPTILGGVLISAEELDLETLAFQLTMPTLDEELAYRGIMLALLNKAVCHSKLFRGISVANLVTSLLFGFVHALSLTAGFSVSFEPLYFAQTFLFALGLAYIVEQTGSLLLPALAHSLGNFLPNLVAMLK
ncbi:CPBP family intramembrane glutamic endopeptidase [Pontibacter actiniarum]|uniref:CPBP family intramembrane metalloprotease n=1 Tax=Pontibacter actiniarum TaxID=323450 RepID=A0A1X9YVM3_9BACT|nr:CPBP family intramembrane glutamic endopeptidase [Pontibacter actiniarum]ARS36892.1 CPBP family intramembrane metalloprotease [Pontibacter actiniarum]